MSKNTVEIPEGFKRITSGKLQWGDLIWREDATSLTGGRGRWDYVDLMVYGEADNKNYFVREIKQGE